MFATSPHLINPKSYCDRQSGLPLYCSQCINSPPPCDCGQPRTKVFHHHCAKCFRTQKDSKRKDKVATPGPKKALVSAQPSHATGLESTQQMHDNVTLPSPSFRYGNYSTNPGWTHYPQQQWQHGPHPNHFASPGHYYGPPPPTYKDFDAVSDFSTSQSPAPLDDSSRLYAARWDKTASTSAYVALQAATHESAVDIPSSIAFPLGQDSYFVDSGASMNCTDTLSHLIRVRALPQPIKIEGINNGVAHFTHVGDLPWMPPGMRQTFYCADLNARLISLNYMCQSRRTQFYNVPKHHCLVIMVDGAHFVTCTRSSNNLFLHPAGDIFIRFPPLATR